MFDHLFKWAHTERNAWTSDAAVFLKMLFSWLLCWPSAFNASLIIDQEQICMPVKSEVFIHIPVPELKAQLMSHTFCRPFSPRCHQFCLSRGSQIDPLPSWIWMEIYVTSMSVPIFLFTCDGAKTDSSVSLMGNSWVWYRQTIVRLYTPTSIQVPKSRSGHKQFCIRSNTDAYRCGQI